MRLARTCADPTRWPPRHWPALQNLATYSPSHHYVPSRSSPRPASQTLAAAAARQPLAMSVPHKPLPLATCPWSSSLSSTSSCRHPQPRHVALQATERRFAGELIRPPRNRPRRAIKGGPRASPSIEEALECTPSPPMAANRLGEGLHPHLRQRQPPPLPRPIRYHQGLPPSVLSTKNPLILP